MVTQKYKPGVVKGYKATDKDMKCRGLQYVLGGWQEVAEGDIVKCGENGLHFCQQPSGVWAYYGTEGTRVFECEAEFVLDEPFEPGASAKSVARRVRLVREIFPDGYRNTGNRNTGYSNTGDSNTGDSNTGNSNTGNWNTGNRNTGNRNTGYSNTGDSNTGDSNTGYRNTGYRNTGNRNTGNRNTGDWNTGNWNTGYRNTGNGNATNHCAGFFCTNEPTVMVFDVDSGLTRNEFMSKFPNWTHLCDSLTQDEPIEFEKYAGIPGITPEKLKLLHKKHIAGRPK